jgi:formate hydrogenlyase transcriptional activator
MTFAANRLRVLLEVCKAIASHQTLPSLGHELATVLHSVVDCEYFDLLLVNPENNLKDVLVIYASSPPKQGTHVHLDDGPGEIVWRDQESRVGTLEGLEAEYPTLAAAVRLVNQHVQSYTIVPLTTTRRRLGVMGFYSDQRGVCSPEEVEFIRLVADLVAIAVENVLNFESAKASQLRLANEGDHLRTLLEVTNAATSKLNLTDIMHGVATEIRRVLGSEFVALVVWDEASKGLCWKVVDFPEGSGLVSEGLNTRERTSPAYCAFSSRKPCVFIRAELERMSEKCGVVATMLTECLYSSCSIPLVSRGEVLGVLDIATRQQAFSGSEVKLLTEIAAEVSVAVDNALAYESISSLRDRLAEEKLYLEEELLSCGDFNEIIGESGGLREVLERVRLVADSDSTVLIFGETGTGKELVARAIHNMSPRRGNTLVKVNCAAIPAGLLESELFGHERGAFTGAAIQRIGRFELANKGTLFLDEIGDISLELQPKLLRALQEREFERLGSSKVIHSDARLIAATNRGLARMVKDGQFRSDLYYRLNVFPITIPPLRDRREDIPLLVRHFVQKYAKRMNRNIESIPSETMRILTQLPWFGNVRELENVIERAVILSRTSVLKLPLSELQTDDTGSSDVPPLLVEDSKVHDRIEQYYVRSDEREVITRVLRETNGILSGPRGAARVLGMKRTTLLAKIQRLGISRFPSQVGSSRE